jgi:hypothetical protein
MPPTKQLNPSLLKGIVAAADPELEALGEALPQYLPVDSSFISSISFEPPDTITVTFKDTGKTYAYAGTQELFDEFASASSKGQFFNSNIR